MVQVLELKGFKALRALNGCSALLLGLNMLPQYSSEPFEQFFKRVKELTEEEQIVLLKTAAMFVKLDREEVEALCSFCVDANGVPYEDSNIKNLGPDELVDVIVAVCLKFTKIKVDLIRDDEKKN